MGTAVLSEFVSGWAALPGAAEEPVWFWLRSASGRKSGGPLWLWGAPGKGPVEVWALGQLEGQEQEAHAGARTGGSNGHMKWGPQAHSCAISHHKSFILNSFLYLDSHLCSPHPYTQMNFRYIKITIKNTIMNKQKQQKKWIQNCISKNEQ